MTRSFDWPALMHLGMCVLRLTPDQFWQLSPLELQLMLGQANLHKSLTRADLAALEKRFPDIGSGLAKGRTDD